VKSAAKWMGFAAVENRKSLEVCEFDLRGAAKRGFILPPAIRFAACREGVATEDTENTEGTEEDLTQRREGAKSEWVLVGDG
jgi:hypothetical protein